MRQDLVALIEREHAHPHRCHHRFEARPPVQLSTQVLRVVTHHMRAHSRQRRHPPLEARQRSFPAPQHGAGNLFAEPRGETTVQEQPPTVPRTRVDPTRATTVVGISST